MSLYMFVIAACLGLSVALAYGYYQLNLRLKSAHQVILGLQNDVSALCAGAVGVSKHLDKIEDQSRYLSDRQDQINVSVSDDRPYIQAMRMAEKGMDAEELMSTCDLSREEAGLIHALHAGHKDSKEIVGLDISFE
ncbi:DUF2802 domain-containing protein [Gammaproteobacteria bacterium AH-315-C21]|nr:DUF2802 domain-containing protein [Gammaproteobacteria bacterium]MBN4078465.1 DUF2802 domain-containing protein [Gammaproteobacteria bacterium AH-315-C21]PCH62726.1 MAG: hypothetical protein COC09_07870 [Gammaproteobacteria bacterium]PCH64171.1 MAG: hypothetical protein COC09_03605 [Gammaproteobacteria bacterium]